MREHAVVIAGGGPTGMMLAAELTLAGVDVAIVERRMSAELESSRAGGLLTRSIEMLDQRGIAERFVSEGQKHQVSMFEGATFVNLPTRHNYVLGLWQKHIERIMAGWVDELGVKILRGREVTGFRQDESGVAVQISQSETLRAQYLVGCDGGRSLIRKAAGIEFPGWDATTSWLIAEAYMKDEPTWGFRQDARGTHAIGKKEEGLVGLVLTEPSAEHTNEPTLRDVSEALIDVYGSDFGIHSPVWVSRFTDMTRQAAAYRAGRVLLAGDAAHVHPPVGGQGLNLGLQDAVNLGWKLAQVVKGTSPDSLLDTYHAERHPVGARVLRTTMALVALKRPDERSKALKDTMAPFLALEEPSRRINAMLSGLDIHYVMPGAARDPHLHPLVGRRMPDLDILTPSGTKRVFMFLHTARPLLLNLGGPDDVNVALWRDRVQLVEAKYEGIWELPALGTVSAPTAVLVRPDGYVAWVGEQSYRGLVESMTTWFGPPPAT